MKKPYLYFKINERNTLDKNIVTRIVDCSYYKIHKLKLDLTIDEIKFGLDGVDFIENKLTVRITFKK